MNVTLSRICLALFVAVVTFLVMPVDAAEQSDRKDQLLAVVYPVADLPVWRYESAKPVPGLVKTPGRPDGQTVFDPSLLIAQIKTTVDPNSWGDRGTVSRHESTASLVVRQTLANHEKIATLLTSLRPHHPGEEVELLGTDENSSALSVSPTPPK
jgi:hypothetical protein